MRALSATQKRAVAEKVRQAVADAFKPWSQDFPVGPDGKTDYDGDMVPGKYQPNAVFEYGGWNPPADGSWAIVWEDGSPYDWPQMTSGGRDEEFGFNVPAVVLPPEVEYLDAIDNIAVLIVFKEAA